MWSEPVFGLFFTRRLWQFPQVCLNALFFALKACIEPGQEACTAWLWRGGQWAHGGSSATRATMQSKPLGWKDPWGYKSIASAPATKLHKHTQVRTLMHEGKKPKNNPQMGKINKHDYWEGYNFVANTKRKHSESIGNKDNNKLNSTKLNSFLKMCPRLSWLTFTFGKQYLPSI